MELSEESNETTQLIWKPLLIKGNYKASPLAKPIWATSRGASQTLR